MPRPVQLYSNRSAAYCGLKEWELALKDADATIAANPTWSRGHSRRGNALHGMQRLEDVS